MVGGGGIGDGDGGGFGEGGGEGGLRTGDGGGGGRGRGGGGELFGAGVDELLLPAADAAPRPAQSSRWRSTTMSSLQRQGSRQTQRS